MRPFVVFYVHSSAHCAICQCASGWLQLHCAFARPSPVARAAPVAMASYGMVSHTARYPARHGIPYGTVSHTAQYHVKRKHIPHGVVSRTARPPMRVSIQHRIPQGPVQHGIPSARYPVRTVSSTTCLPHSIPLRARGEGNGGRGEGGKGGPTALLVGRVSRL